ncbi:hypothetical protein ABID08_002626 [Rhizobium binae]|uniref:Uncharacterized protein n=1 Tax=Rhizobium binae TaxID=1138190 RepID=A0ABV2MFL2_9HYPH|nr:hypothetical protein [Rhizobium binae]MBX4994782.1 hypothetical protein [Rhizobium binae]NKL49815.1 hypothetical protein [Rhizobium leguminosarum bv. viciae]QSY85313.1 hypothetical protein J2J99_25100 [Rhizobium binae]
MITDRQASSEMRSITERYFRTTERQAPKMEPANLKLNAMSCETGAFLQLNAKRQESGRSVTDYGRG